MRSLCITAASLVLALVLPGCCPGPKELAAGTWARSRTGLGSGTLAVLDIDRNLIAFPPAEDTGARSADGSHSLVTVKLWLEGDPSRLEPERLRLSPLFVRQQQGQIVAQHPLPEETFHKAGVIELAVPLTTDDGKPLPLGQYALQVFLQRPDEPYPALAQVELIVRGCAFY
jgi:hypothetical protein